jgi:hypothetical protein
VIKSFVNAVSIFATNVDNSGMVKDLVSKRQKIIPLNKDVIHKTSIKEIQKSKKGDKGKTKLLKTKSKKNSKSQAI